MCKLLLVHIMQSVFSRINANHLVLPYSRFTVLGLIFCPEPKSALHFGLGGGSIPRWLHIHFPELQQTVIEKNASVIEAARDTGLAVDDNGLLIEVAAE